MAVGPRPPTRPSDQSCVAFISDESMDALEAQKDRTYVAPALNILHVTLLVAEKAQCTISRSDVWLANV